MINSLIKNRIGIFLMLLSSLNVVFGQYFWKISDQNYIFLIIGYFLYGIGAILMIFALKKGKLSVLHPFLSFNYIFSLMIGRLFLDERISSTIILGIVVIMTGVFLIGGSDDK